MKGIYLAILLTVYTYVFLVTGNEEPHCFHFTWPGATASKDFNCTEHNKDNPFTPCIEQLFFYETKPNVNEIWNYKNKSMYIQRMEPGYVCVKFTYIYNGAVINVSYFLGKVTEDQTTPVTSGCYVLYTEGYNIEACACKSKDGNSMPCNSTIRNTHSPLIIIVTAVVLLFIYKIFDIS